jgi:hypothetical protein
MGYVGNEPSVNFTSFAKQDITGDGGTSYTLTHAVANANEIEVYVNNVRQEPTSAYSASGTALTMTGNVASTDDFYVIYLGKALQTTTPPDGSVSTAKLADSAVTNAKINNSTIDLTSKVTGVLPVANGGSGVSSVPSFFAFQATNDWINNVTGGTTIVLNSTKHNNGNHYSTTTGKFTAPINGVYAFSLAFYVKNASGTAKFRVCLDDTTINYNNTGYPLISVYTQDADTNDEVIGTSWNYYMTANQTMSIKSDDSGTDYFGSMSFFSGFYIGG